MTRTGVLVSQDFCRLRIMRRAEPRRHFDTYLERGIEIVLEGLVTTLRCGAQLLALSIKAFAAQRLTHILRLVFGSLEVTPT